MIGSDRLLTQILLLALIGACLWVLAPFMSALFWAAVVAFASWPLMRLLTAKLNGNIALAAAILTTGWVLLVAIPLFWIGFNIADYIRDGTEMIKNLRITGMPPEPDWLQNVPFFGERLHEMWITLDEEGPVLFSAVKPYMGMLGNWLLGRSASIAGGMLELTLSLFLVFFFYRDGERLALFVRALVHRLLGTRTDYGNSPSNSGICWFLDCRCSRSFVVIRYDLYAEPHTHGSAFGVDTGRRLVVFPRKLYDGYFYGCLGFCCY